MIGALILMGTLILVALGWVLYGHWYNHVSLYCAVWGTSMYLFRLRLIQYYPVEDQTYIVIFAGVAAFILGSMGHRAWSFVSGQAHGSLSTRENRHPESSAATEKYLIRIVWSINVITLVTVLQHWYVAAKIAGGIPQVLVLANLFYSYRVEHGLPGAIPYLKSLALLGALFGGH